MESTSDIVTQCLATYGKCQVERFTTPLDKSPHFVFYNSKNKQDIALGSQGNAFKIQWTMPGFAFPILKVPFLIRTLIHALASYVVHGAVTFLLLPLIRNKDDESENTYRTLLTHPHLIPLLLWKKNTLTLQSSRHPLITSPCSTDFVLYTTNYRTVDHMQTLIDKVKDHMIDVTKPEEDETNTKWQNRAVSMVSTYIPKYNKLAIEAPKETKYTKERPQYIGKVDFQHTLLTLGLQLDTILELTDKIDETLLNLEESSSPKLANILTTTKLRYIKNTVIPRAIIMAHDKNPGELTEECPLRYFNRIKSELYDISTDNKDDVKGKAL
jgi:hypothetical protein